MPRPNDASPSILSALIVPIGLTLLLSLPAILSGYLPDDLVFTSPIYKPDSPFRYYDFVEQSRTRHLLPWWHAENIRIEFFRPLSSAALALEFALGDRTPLFSHLVTTTLFLTLLVGLYAVLRASPIPYGYIKWIMLTFAAAGHHAISIGFISSRHALMANTFAVWALTFHVRQSRHPYAYSALSLGFFLLALLSGESALAFPLFVFGCDLIWRKGDIRQRLTPSMPIVGLAILYLVAYTSLGFGAKGVGAYLNPVSSPVRFLQSAPGKILAIIGSFVFGIPAQLRLSERAGDITLAAGLLALSLICLSAGLASQRSSPLEKRIMEGPALGGALSLIPGLTDGIGHNLILAGLGFSIFIILLLSILFIQPHPSLFRRTVMRALATMITIGLFGLSPLIRIATNHFVINQGSAMNERLATSPLPCKPGADVYLLNGEFMTVQFAPYAVATTDPPVFNRWHELVSVNDDILIERVGTDRLVIKRNGASLIDPVVFDRFTDARTALPRGSTVIREGLSARILDRTPDGPSSIEFTIPDMARRDKVCLLRLDNYRLKPFELPENGESYTLAYKTPLVYPDVAKSQ